MMLTKKKGKSSDKPKHHMVLLGKIWFIRDRIDESNQLDEPPLFEVDVIVSYSVKVSRIPIYTSITT
jgi:hypothetical protein